MNIEDFLIDLIVDIYEVNCMNNGITMTEFDSKFLDDNGQFMNDRDYLIKYGYEVFNDELYSDLYNTLISLEDDKYTIEKILPVIIKRYIVMNIKSNNIVRYLNSNNINDIKELFISNSLFGIDLIKSFCLSLVDVDSYSNNIKSINTDYINKWNDLINNSSIDNIYSINEVLRNVIVNLYNYYISKGNSIADSLLLVREYFTNNVDPLNELSNLGINNGHVKQYILKLMYVDLYEDINNESIIIPQNNTQSIVQQIPKLSLNTGLVYFPIQDNIWSQLLLYFITLQENKSKKKRNRNNTFKTGEISRVEKYLPSYFLDEIDYSKTF